jgi:hypothetical protein
VGGVLAACDGDSAHGRAILSTRSRSYLSFVIESPTCQAGRSWTPTPLKVQSVTKQKSLNEFRQRAASFNSECRRASNDCPLARRRPR